MTEDEVFRQLLPHVREVTGAPEARIHMDSTLMDDLGAESLDLLDFVFLIEETFGVTIAADEFERQARARMPGLVYERDGLLTVEGAAELRQAMPEVPPQRIQPGLPKAAVPRLLTVAVFVHLIQRKLAERGSATR